MQRLSIAAGTIIVSAVLLFGGAFAYAESNDSRGNSDAAKKNVEILQEQIKKLNEQIKELMKKQQEAVKDFRKSLVDDDDDDGDDDSRTGTSTRAAVKEFRSDLEATRSELKFLRSLRRGMSGDDVRDLQELLSQDSDIFPSGLITGFFGALTEQAVKRFQEKHGIERLGIFGPKTQAKILALFVGRELPPGIIKRLGLGTSTTTPGAGVVTICHKPAGASPQTIVIAVPALGAHLAHGDTAGICPGAATTTPPTSPPPPPADTTAPVISGQAVSGISSTTAMLSWSTNETATGKVYYSTSVPVNLATALTVSSASATTSHALTLTGLTASTTYSYALEAKDAAGNTATTSAQSFVTIN
ncbi:peptidoglycan-binding protein [Candidatus Kaiserbacteria bacterium]|nr:peptidoglycan-binding protein [Candidatus Kaiserbacteria bacterium]